jgi:hypothetical protein
MRKLTVEGNQGLQELQLRDIWSSILQKKQQHSSSLNDFLNSLTDAEFSEFIQSRDIPMDKLKETGRAKDEFGLNLKELSIDAREKMLI